MRAVGIALGDQRFPGWERHPGRGCGTRALVRAALDWAPAQGCTEFASDTTPDNEISQQAHEALGFQEVERVVCYRLALENGRKGHAP